MKITELKNIKFGDVNKLGFSKDTTSTQKVSYNRKTIYNKPMSSNLKINYKRKLTTPKPQVKASPKVKFHKKSNGNDYTVTEIILIVLIVLLSIGIAVTLAYIILSNIVK